MAKGMEKRRRRKMARRSVLMAGEALAEATFPSSERAPVEEPSANPPGDERFEGPIADALRWLRLEVKANRLSNGSMKIEVELWHGKEFICSSWSEI